MNRELPDNVDPTPDSDFSPKLLFESLSEQFRVILGRSETVLDICRKLTAIRGRPPTGEERQSWLTASQLLNHRNGLLTAPLFHAIETIASEDPDPWPYLKSLIGSTDDDLRQRAAKLVIQAVRSQQVRVTIEILDQFAEVWSGKAFQGDDMEEAALLLIDRCCNSAGSDKDPVLSLFLNEPDPVIRELAATILDRRVGLPASETVSHMLGDQAYAILAPYLEYTRATHRDLLYLISRGRNTSTLYEGIRRAETLIGSRKLRSVLAALGWNNVNQNIDVREYHEVRIDHGLPLFLSQADKDLFRGVPGFDDSDTHYIVTACGASPSTIASNDDQTGRMRLFQNLNLLHAEALEDFLAIKPLDTCTAERLIATMGLIVENYVELFKNLSDDCDQIIGVYQRLRRDVEKELSQNPEPTAQATRLVTMFEDPQRPDDVRTLHGLKRYLHQKGLKLGFKLATPGRSCDRTIHVLLLNRDSTTIGDPLSIRYSDLDPDPNESDDTMPYAVRIVVSAFARQMLYGQRYFPKTDVFCYGNEIQYYLSYGAHPAFLRINFSVPFQGGMIDLAYYGVSKNELNLHPSLHLDVLNCFFKKLEYDIEISNTHVHARYDKEHARTLADLCSKAELLFCLAPYFMDLDWTVGNLDLSTAARSTVASYWASLFLSWGALPLKYLLSPDRRHHMSDSPGAGANPVHWDGESAFPAAFRDSLSKETLDALSDLMERFGIEQRSWPGDRTENSRGSLFLEQVLLASFNRSVETGEIVRTGTQFRRGKTRKVHETEIFAEIVCNEDLLRKAGLLGNTLSGLETLFEYAITGWVEDHEVHASKIQWVGESVFLFLMHDSELQTPLAFLCRRESVTRSADGNLHGLFFEPEGLLSGLRRACFPLPPAAGYAEVESSARRMHRFMQSHGRRPFLTGARNVLHGNVASRGRSSGFAKFYSESSKPVDYRGSILVSPAVRPDDIPILAHAAGVLSTGGGILSHAGLMANQFRIPAMVVGGTWDVADALRPVFRYVTMDYRETQVFWRDLLLTQRTDFRPRQNTLHEGDLVVVDADAGLVQVFGQDAVLLALRQGLLSLGLSIKALRTAEDARAVMEQRGRIIRSLQGIKKAVSKLTDQEQARYATYEFLLGNDLAGIGGTAAIRSDLLADLITNETVGPIAEEEARMLLDELGRKSETFRRRAIEGIPKATEFHEVLARRHLALHALRLYEETRLCLYPDKYFETSTDRQMIDEVFVRQARLIWERVADGLEATPGAYDRHSLRLLREIETFGITSGDGSPCIDDRNAGLALVDDRIKVDAAMKNIIRAVDGGLALHNEIGWKAANLAELPHVTRHDLVPQWFAISNRCFLQMLQMPARSDGRQTTLREAIDDVLANTALNPCQQSAAIRDLWDSMVIPTALTDELQSAFDDLVRPPCGPAVAIRSSSFEEDSQQTSGAGQFDTFLFVRGFDDLLRLIRRTWSGLWNERALHQRALHRSGPSRFGGGVIVQRMIHSRVSGVLQTVNIASGEPAEIVINAGLGVGEGIVSGTVAADQIIVKKPAGQSASSLMFHYATADKREYITLHESGSGTVRKTAPYHQRFRPALEYVEINQLVEIALLVERTFHYPVDLEFGFEGDRLWILQVRPVTTVFDQMTESLQDFPLQNQTATTFNHRKVPS